MTRASAAAIAAALAATGTGMQQAPASGLDARAFTVSVRPQDDLYRYVNGRWLDATPMPDDRVSHTAATELVEKTNADVRAIIEELATSRHVRAGSPAQQLVDLYRSMLDEAAIEARGLSPLEPELRAIDRINSTRALADRAGHLSATTTAGPFHGTVGLNPRNPSGTLLHLSQGGLLLAREHYLSADDSSQRIRRAYRDYLVRIFRIAARADPEGDADAVLALERDLAAAHDDSPATDEPMPLARMNAAFPGFDWMAWGRPQGLDRADGVVVLQPAFFRTFATLVPSRPLPVWRAWLAARYLTAMAPYVSDNLSQARFDFFGRFLTGQTAPIPRWKRGVALVNRLLGDSVGRLYVERHFPKSSRTKVERIVANLVGACRQALSEIDWLSGPARAEARAKLSALKVRVGYPDVWTTDDGLEIRPDDLFGNLERGQRAETARRLAHVVAGGDSRGEWIVTRPQNVNAYYVPATNEIILPAAFLQPPYFDPAADDAVNYGAIGAVIGHELAHGLDGTGRWYDRTGALRDWWRAEDELAWRERAAQLLAELNRYPPIDARPFDGTLAVAEAMNDLAGLALAYRAYQNSLGGRAAAVLDGLSGDQRFFLAWARIWRSQERPEYRRELLLTSRHPPADYRANGIVGHLDAFYRAFNVGPGDALFIPPARRIRLF